MQVDPETDFASGGPILALALVANELWVLLQSLGGGAARRF